MAALVALPAGAAMVFTELKDLLDLTDGNLSSHLSMLEQAGYVSTEKEFVGKRPRTSAWATSEGRDAFAACVEELDAIIQTANGSTPGH